MNRLLPGLCLVVLLPLTQPAAASDWLYRMQQGDTLWDLCLKYTHKRGCWMELGKYNSIKHGRRIQPGTVIKVPASWLRTLPKVGQVGAVQGDVTYTAASGEESALRQGQALMLGAGLRSGERGSATIHLGAHQRVLLRPDSQLILENASSFEQSISDVELRLESGNVEASVRKGTKSRFQIKTPAAIASVRGTRYRLAADATNKVTRSEVLDGNISFGSGETVSVPAGFGVSAKQGEPPTPPRALLPAPKLAGNAFHLPASAPIRWSANPDALAWQVDVYPPEGDQLLFSQRLSEPSFSFDDLQEQCYRLQISAIDSDGFQGLESVATLCVVAPLAPVASVSVRVSDDDIPSVSWPAVRGASQYAVTVAADKHFDTVTWHKVVSASELQLPQVVDSRVWVKVVAFDEHGNRADATVQTFTTEGTDWRTVLGVGLFVLVALL